MVTELQRVELADAPELASIVEEVRASGRPCMLTRDGDDSFWNIVGIGRSVGPGDGSTDKYKYLAKEPRTNRE
ncbi:MAG: hypothetical protein ACYDCQ_14765 [Dehalococcoidia bacterium]